jgi:hypothetical protein
MPPDNIDKRYSNMKPTGLRKAVQEYNRVPVTSTEREKLMDKETLLINCIHRNFGGLHGKDSQTGRPE